MITRLSIENFKSVRRLDVECKKVNLFIGEPNTGKSNILKALALLSWCGRNSQPLSDYVRFQFVQDLFYDRLLHEEIKISMSSSSGQPIRELYVRFNRDRFEFRSQPDSGPPFRELTHEGEAGGGGTHPQMDDVRFYRFKKLDRYGDSEPGSLKPPVGAVVLSGLSRSW
jgi:hypothetical protein